MFSSNCECECDSICAAEMSNMTRFWPSGVIFQALNTPKLISVSTLPRQSPAPQGCKRDVEVRDRDVWLPVRDETETETLIGRDRDIFRDLGISEVFLPCISFSSKLTKFKNSEVCRAVSLCM